jgi:hypothetical protein
VACPWASNPYPAKRTNTRAMDVIFMISIPKNLRGDMAFGEFPATKHTILNTGNGFLHRIN